MDSRWSIAMGNSGDNKKRSYEISSGTDERSKRPRGQDFTYNPPKSSSDSSVYDEERKSRVNDGNKDLKQLQEKQLYYEQKLAEIYTEISQYLPPLPSFQAEVSGQYEGSTSGPQQREQSLPSQEIAHLDQYNFGGILQSRPDQITTYVKSKINSYLNKKFNSQ